MLVRLSLAATTTIALLLQLLLVDFSGQVNRTELLQGVTSTSTYVAVLGHERFVNPFARAFVLHVTVAGVS